MNTTKTQEVKEITKEVETREIVSKVETAFRFHKTGKEGNSLGFKNIADRIAIVPLKPAQVKELKGFSEGLKARNCAACYSGLPAHWNFISCNRASVEGLPCKPSKNNLEGLTSEVKFADKTCKHHKTRKTINEYREVIKLPSYFGRAIGTIITESEALQVINYKLEINGFKPIAKIGDKITI